MCSNYVKIIYIYTYTYIYNINSILCTYIITKKNLKHKNIKSALIHLFHIVNCPVAAILNSFSYPTLPKPLNNHPHHIPFPIPSMLIVLLEHLFSVKCRFLADWNWFFSTDWLHLCCQWQQAFQCF